MADLGTNSGFYAARPTLTLGGRQDEGLTQGLLTLRVSENTDGLYSCEASFGNWGSTNAAGEPGFLYFDRTELDFGRVFTVEIGEGDTADTVFEGRIVALEGRYPQKRPPEIQVFAEDRFQDLRMVRRSRAFEDTTDAEVIEAIAALHGLTPEVDLDGPSYPVLSQVNQSDLAFLRARARAVDAELWMEGSTLRAVARSRRRRGEPVTLTWGEGLREFAVCADLAHQRTSLSASGWDVRAKEAIEEVVDEGAIASELRGGDSGTALLAASLGDRAEQLVHHVPLSTPEARSLAEAAYRRRARRFVRGHGVAEGDGRLRVGGQVELSALGPLFDGVYDVIEIHHTFDPENGLRTAFRVERPGLGRPS